MFMYMVYVYTYILNFNFRTVLASSKHSSNNLEDFCLVDTSWSDKNPGPLRLRRPDCSESGKINRQDVFFVRFKLKNYSTSNNFTRRKTFDKNYRN